MNDQDLKRQAEAYREARDYADLVAYPPFQRFMRELDARASQDMENLCAGGDTAAGSDHDALTFIRAIRWVRAVPERFAADEPRLRQRLAEAGVSVDAPIAI